MLFYKRNRRGKNEYFPDGITQSLNSGYVPLYQAPCRLSQQTLFFGELNENKTCLLNYWSLLV